MDPRIIKFIKQHHVLTLATSNNNIPWTAHCFYAFLEKEKALVFTTDNNTRHGQEMLDNQLVAGGIVLETKVVGRIKGIQLTGTVSKIQDQRPKTKENLENDMIPSPLAREPVPGLNREDTGGYARKTYLSRFPYAALLKTTLWILEIETVKFTDNRLGFGKKLHWVREKKQE